MSNYPGYGPNYKVVQELGGYNRNCFVVELLSEGKLNNAEIAMVKERIEAILATLANSVGFEKSKVIHQSDFDSILRAGLRIE